MTTATLNVETVPKTQKFAMSGSADDVLVIEPIATSDNGVQLGRYRGMIQLKSPTGWSFAKEASSGALEAVAANVPWTMPIYGRTTLYITGAGADDLTIATVR